LREVATAFPQATVELWAVDEHRIGREAHLEAGLDATRPAPSRPPPCIGTTGATSSASCIRPPGAPSGTWPRR
jgi:hypothetical protein